jgi:CHAD domain-containing protein
MAPTDAIEIEWQFDALDLRPTARWLAALAGSRTIEPLGELRSVAKPTVLQEDLYLDTEDWRIAQAGYVLRIRHAKNKREITLKALEHRGAQSSALPRQRREVNEPLENGGNRWLETAGPVGWRVSALIGKRSLQPVLEVQTRRRPFALHLGEEDVAEIALDETSISVDDQNPMRLLRVEVEVQPPWVEVLKPVVLDLQRAGGLTPAALSKFEAGVLARGYVLPTEVNLGPTGVSAGSSIGTVADAVVRRHLGALLAHEAGTRLGEDVEELHDMRVATRRLRAALDVFRDILPPHYRALTPELAWLAQLLGTVRDLDVQIERLDASPEWHGPWSSAQVGPSPVDELRGIFGRERDRARAVLLQALDSSRYERLTTGLTALAQQGPAQRSAAGHLPATVVAPSLLEQRHRSAVKSARRARRSGNAEDFHRLRIRCKRLRYALEFVADVYGEPATQFVRQLTRLQDLLGNLQDSQVSMERLHTLATLGQPPLSRATVFLMGAVAEGSRQEAASMQARARTRLGVLRGDEWQRLSLALERLRMAADPEDRFSLRLDGRPASTPVLAPPGHAPLPPSGATGSPPVPPTPPRLP